MSDINKTNANTGPQYNSAMWDPTSKEQLAWGRLKTIIGGLFPATQMEQWLLLNDYAALGLETMMPTIPPQGGVAVLTEFKTKTPTKNE